MTIGTFVGGMPLQGALHIGAVAMTCFFNTKVTTGTKDTTGAVY